MSLKRSTSFWMIHDWQNGLDQLKERRWMNLTYGKNFQYSCKESFQSYNWSYSTVQTMIQSHRHHSVHLLHKINHHMSPILTTTFSTMVYSAQSTKTNALSAVRSEMSKQMDRKDQSLCSTSHVTNSSRWHHPRGSTL